MKVLLTVFILSLFSSANIVIGEEGKDQALYEKAQQMSKKLIIVDTHIDLPYRLKSNWEDVSVRTPKGHFDYPRFG